MAQGLHFVTVDVFTSTPLAGNPLAIVLVPKGHALSENKTRMLAIAREFNYSETVFLHEAGRGEDEEHGEWNINIFTTEQELPFAGHPTIGTAWLCAQRAARLQSATLHAPAGPIAAVFERANDGRIQAAARIPHNAHQHANSLSAEELLVAQPGLRGKLVRPHQPVVSIVKGMTFALIEVNSLARLSEARTTSVATSVRLDAEWSPSFCGMYFYMIEGAEAGRVGVHARMIDGVLEDPATGSAAATLAAYLSLWSEHADTRDGTTTQYEVEQGADMGRRSSIFVRVKLGEAGQLSEIELSGTCVRVMEGVFHEA